MLYSELNYLIKILFCDLSKNDTKIKNLHKITTNILIFTKTKIFYVLSWTGLLLKLVQKAKAASKSIISILPK